MPARPSHLPHNLERNALQKLSGTDGLPLVKLHPTGKRTVAGMIAKGWIEKRVNGGETFRITPAGEAALKARDSNRRFWPLMPSPRAEYARSDGR